MTYGQIPLSWASQQASAAVAGGLSLDRLFDRALITPKFGDERDQISPLQLMVFYAAIVLETDDGTHSMVRHRHAPATGPLGFRILFGSVNLGDGLLALSKFYEVSSRSIRMRLSTEADQAFLAIQVEDERGGGMLMEDILLTYLYLGLTCFLGRPFPAAWVGTRDASHFSLGSLHHVIGSPVRFHSCAGVSFPKALLGSRPPIGGVDEFSWRPMDVALSMMATPRHPQPGVTIRDLRVDAQAADHMMAPSTYRRMMARNGLGLRQVRERALLDAGLDLLTTRSYSVEAIAADLGYSDAKSFRRFVKRATGRTPSQLREDAAPGVSATQLRARLKDILGLTPL